MSHPPPERPAFPEVSDDVDQPKIDAYAELSGDYNPLHVDVEVAEASEFGGTIAHGPVALQAFFRATTAWLGTDALPPGTTVKVTYRAPVRPGDRISSRARDVRSENSATLLDAECVNQDETTVVSVAASLPAGG